MPESSTGPSASEMQTTLLTCGSCPVFQSSRRNSPRAAAVGARRFICSSDVKSQQDGAGKRAKPNLRETGRFGNPKLVAVSCIIAGILMYPMLFEPFVGIFGTSAEGQAEKIKRSGLDPSKTRPSNMPEWTSPFGPPKRKDDED